MSNYDRVTPRIPRVHHSRCSVSKYSSEGIFGIFGDGLDNKLQIKSNRTSKMLNGFLGNIYCDIAVVDGEYHIPQGR